MALMMSAVVVCAVLFFAWKAADSELRYMQSQVDFWQKYAQQLEQQAQKDREAKHVETNIEQLNDYDVVQWMCESGYLSDCNEQ